MLTVLFILFPVSTAATVYAHVDADGSVAEARRMMRVDDTSLRQETSKQHLASISSHRTSAMEARVAENAHVEISSFVECSEEGGTCQCDGVVLYGRPGSDWKEQRAEGAVLCTAAMFDATPAPDGQQNVCRCYSMHWCGENNVDNLDSDSAHRRRNGFGIPGRNLHQWLGAYFKTTELGMYITQSVILVQIRASELIGGCTTLLL